MSIQTTKMDGNYTLKSMQEVIGELVNLHRVKKCLTKKHNYCNEKALTVQKGGILSDCGEYLDVWTYDEDGEPVLASDFIRELQSLGFGKCDWIHTYEFKKVYVGEGHYAIIDYNFRLADLFHLVGLVK
jgi:hypothetical protein